MAHLNDAIRRLVEEAKRSPTPENVQDWTFAWDGVHLRVERDGIRSSYLANRGNTIALLAFGFLLTHLEVAARGEGLDLHPEAWTLTADGPLGVTFRVTPRAPEPHPLLPGLQHRHTDRRVYRPPTFPDALRTDLADACAHTTLQIASPVPEALLRRITEAEISFVDDDHTRNLMLDWTRYTLEEADQRLDGMYWKAWGLPRATLFFMARPLLFHLGPYFGSNILVRRLFHARLRTAALLIFRPQLHPDHAHNLRAIVDTGRDVMRVWFHISQAGLSAQPYSLASLAAYFHQRDLLDTPPLRHFGELGRRAVDVLQQEGSHPGEPLFMLRVGQPPEAYPTAWKTRRKSLEHFLHNENEYK